MNGDLECLVAQIQTAVELLDGFMDLLPAGAPPERVAAWLAQLHRACEVLRASDFPVDVQVVEPGQDVPGVPQLPADVGVMVVVTRSVEARRSVRALRAEMIGKAYAFHAGELLRDGATRILIPGPDAPTAGKNYLAKRELLHDCASATIGRLREEHGDRLRIEHERPRDVSLIEKIWLLTLRDARAA